jgi:hypothetical protein
MNVRKNRPEDPYERLNALYKILVHISGPANRVFRSDRWIRCGMDSLDRQKIIK